MNLLNYFKRAFGAQPPLHPIDRSLAKRWIKKRLALVYPELRNNPKALERAYHELSLEPRLGVKEEDEAEAVFEMKLPTGLS